MRWRRTLEPAFKLQVIEIVRTQDLSIAQVCRDLQLSRSAVTRWLHQFDEEQAGLPGKGVPLSAEQRRIVSWKPKCARYSRAMAY